MFCALAEETIGPMRPLEDYIERARRCCRRASRARWFILNCIRQLVRDGKAGDVQAARRSTASCAACSPEHQLTVLTDLVEQWGALGADRAMFDLLKKVTAT